MSRALRSFIVVWFLYSWFLLFIIRSFLPVTFQILRTLPFLFKGFFGELNILPDDVHVSVLDEDVPMSSARRVSVPDTEQLGAPRRLASGDMDEDQKLFAKPNDRLHVSSYHMPSSLVSASAFAAAIGIDSAFPSCILSEYTNSIQMSFS
jgi:hypothetical protein